MVFLYDRRVLYVPSEAECPAHVVQSVQDIRREITDMAKQFSAGNELELKLRAMRAACIHFMNRVQKRTEILDFATSHGHWANWEFMDALGQWRAFMAVYIGMIASAYDVEPPAFLRILLPDVPDKPAELVRAKSDIDDTIEQFGRLSPAECQAQLDQANRYLASEAGRREFGDHSATKPTLPSGSGAGRVR
jgi:hypothetical protein